MPRNLEQFILFMFLLRKDRRRIGGRLLKLKDSLRNLTTDIQLSIIKSMKTLDEIIKEQLKSPSFRREWKKSELQYQLVRQLIKARLEKGVSQRQLAKKAKTTQAVISRIESMTMSPSLGVVGKLVEALGMKVKFCVQ